MKSVVVFAAVLAVAVPTARAESIKKHEQKEQHRIDKGVQSGKLTPKEATRLENQQKIIEQERDQAAADGKVSKRERQDIRHDQKRLSHDIHKKKYNDKVVK